jgi:hypothetical protein
MVDLIADVDGGLVALAAHATPTLLWVILCRIRIWLWSLWHRVFAPELWGPYGPWNRVVQAVRRLVDALGRSPGRS